MAIEIIDKFLEAHNTSLTNDFIEELTAIKNDINLVEGGQNPFLEEDSELDEETQRNLNAVFIFQAGESISKHAKISARQEMDEKIVKEFEATSRELKNCGRETMGGGLFPSESFPGVSTKEVKRILAEHTKEDTLSDNVLKMVKAGVSSIEGEGQLDALEKTAFTFAHMWDSGKLQLELADAFEAANYTTGAQIRRKLGNYKQKCALELIFEKGMAELRQELEQLAGLDEKRLEIIRKMRAFAKAISEDEKKLDYTRNGPHGFFCKKVDALIDQTEWTDIDDAWPFTYSKIISD